jgi:hypothetical protein
VPLVPAHHASWMFAVGVEVAEVLLIVIHRDEYLDLTFLARRNE